MLPSIRLQSAICQWRGAWRQTARLGKNLDNNPQIHPNCLRAEASQTSFDLLSAVQSGPGGENSARNTGAADR